MTDLKSQRKIAARLLGCAKSHVWIDPKQGKNVEEAITAADIRRTISSGYIRAIPKAGISNFRKKIIKKQKSRGRRHGHGSLKGTLNARSPTKASWIKNIRALRKELKKLRNDGAIDRHDYRKLYRKAKGGFFRSKKHMMIFIESNNMLKKSGGVKNA